MKEDLYGGGPLGVHGQVLPEKLMTIEEYLALPQPEQEKIAGKLTPGPWKHDPLNGMFGECRKCKTVISSNELETTDCPSPTRIYRLDWNHAKALQRECQHMEFMQALDTVSNVAIANENYPCGIVYEVWLICKALPIHYIAACLKAKGELE